MLVISIDPGETKSGVAIIMLNKECPNKSELIGFNVDNADLLDKVKEYYVKYDTTVVIEDIRPYRHKLSMNIINTCKFIGELNYRLNSELFCKIQYVSRGEVKRWLYGRFYAVSVERIEKKIAYLDGYGEKNNKKRYKNLDGELRKPSFHWVDDRISIECMKEFWNIPTPKPGKKNIYGFSSHSWQALAAGSCFLFPIKE